MPSQVSIYLAAPSVTMKPRDRRSHRHTACTVASSSRSQRAMWPTTTLTLSDQPRTVRGGPL